MNFNLFVIKDLSIKTILLGLLVLLLICIIAYYFMVLRKGSILKKIETPSEEQIPIEMVEVKESDVTETFESKDVSENENSNENPNVYFNIQVNGEEKGTVEFKLYDEVVPKTAINFRTLASEGKYNNCKFHRVIKDFMIQGGDFTNNNGTGGISIYGDNFEDENFELTHDKPGLLSMANSGPNTNGSQFFITTKETPHLDGKHVVFGEVTKNMELIRELEDQETNENDEPLQECIISQAGIIN